VKLIFSKWLGRSKTIASFAAVSSLTVVTLFSVGCRQDNISKETSNTAAVPLAVWAVSTAATAIATGAIVVSIGGVTLYAGKALINVIESNQGNTITVSNSKDWIWEMQFSIAGGAGYLGVSDGIKNSEFASGLGSFANKSNFAKNSVAVVSGLLAAEITSQLSSDEMERLKMFKSEIEKKFPGGSQNLCLVTRVKSKDPKNASLTYFGKQETIPGSPFEPAVAFTGSFAGAFIKCAIETKQQVSVFEGIKSCTYIGTQFLENHDCTPSEGREGSTK
jgi:hypothetical protein